MTAKDQKSPRSRRDSDRIRVAQCIHGLGVGGAQQVVRFIASDGDPERFEHFVYTPHGGAFQPYLEDTGATIRIVERMIPKFDPVWIWRLAGQLRADDIDVVHCHLFGDTLHGYFAARAAGGLPLVITTHSSITNFSGMQRKGYRWLIQRADRTIGCSESSGRQFREFLAGTDTRIDVVPNGLAPESVTRADDQQWQSFKDEFDIPSAAPIIGAVGRLVPSKGFGRLIEAFGTVTGTANTDARLVILGDGALRNELEQQISQLGLTGRVIMTGYRSDAPALTTRFDVLAFASDYEGLSLSMLEGMASSVCLVATDAPGICDILDDNENALLVPIRDVPALTGALLRVLSDDRLRSRLGAAGRDTFYSNYTARHMAQRYEDIYQEVIDARTTP